MSSEAYQNIADYEEMDLDRLEMLVNDLAKMENAFNTKYRLVHLKFDAARSVFKRRRGDTLTVSEHAVVRYLEKVKGLDIDAIRKEIREQVRDLLPVGSNGLLWEGDVRTYIKDGFTYVVSQDHRVITLYPYDPDYDPELLPKSRKKLRRELWHSYRNNPDAAKAVLRELEVEAKLQGKVVSAEDYEEAIQDRLKEMRADEAHEYNPELVDEIKRRDALPPEASFNNVGDMLDWLDKDECE